MDYCFWNGLIMVLLIQHGISEEQFSSINITTKDGQDLSQEPVRPSLDVVSVLTPPSLMEVHQAVQDASEQVVGRSAEEVLKELLERVVETVLGQVEGNEVKLGQVAVEEGIEEDLLETEKGDFKLEVNKKSEVLQQVSDNKVLCQEMGENEGGNCAKEEQTETEGMKGEVIEDGVVHRETVGEIAAETTSVGTGGQATDRLEVINKSLVTKHDQNAGKNTVAVEEMGKDLIVVKVGAEGSRDQDPLSTDGIAEIETWEAAEHPDVVEAAGVGEPEQETMVDPHQDMEMTNVEQIGNPWVKGDVPGQDALVDQMEGEAKVLSSVGYAVEATQTAAQVPVEKNEAKGPEGGMDQGHSAAVGGVVKEVGDEGAARSKINGTAVTKEESVVLLTVGVVQGSEARDQIALETPHNGERGDQDLISAPEPGDQSPESRVPTPNPFHKSNHGNEIITPTHNVLAHVPIVVQPTLDNLVKDVLAILPQAEGKKRGQESKLVEPTAATTGIADVGLQAWKIGAISAAVFLILETIILIYILKYRNKSNRNRALPCEEGCADPEATTGGDCRDDTFRRGNRDDQPKAASDLSPVGQNKEKDKLKLETPMSDLLFSSKAKSSNVGTAQDSSTHLRTSIL